MKTNKNGKAAKVAKKYRAVTASKKEVNAAIENLMDVACTFVTHGTTSECFCLIVAWLSERYNVGPESLPEDFYNEVIKYHEEYHKGPGILKGKRGERITDVVSAAAEIKNWDFSLKCRVLSCASNSEPDLQDIEWGGDITEGATLQTRIARHYNGDIAVYDFGNGNVGLCLRDQHECHYFVYESGQVVTDKAPQERKRESAF